MKVTESCKNKVRVIGEVISELTFSHDCKNASMFKFMVKISRRSGRYDEIPVTISSLVLENIGTTIEVGKKYEILGEYRSFNEWIDPSNPQKSSLKLYIIAKDIYEATEETDETTNNSIEMEGYISNVKPLRETPYGRKIIDVMVAINRYGTKSSYIPCIVWNPTRHIENSLKVGERVAITGRIQSREYLKKYADESIETKIAYEVSVQKISVEKESEEAVI